MGCRLYHAKTYQIEWSGGWYNWNAEQFHKILTELGIQIWWQHGDDDDPYGSFEISVDEWNKLRAKLAEIPKEDDDLYVLEGDYEYLINWKNLKDWFNEVDREYDHDNGYIHFEWF